VIFLLLYIFILVLYSACSTYYAFPYISYEPRSWIKVGQIYCSRINLQSTFLHTCLSKLFKVHINNLDFFIIVVLIFGND